MHFAARTRSKLAASSSLAAACWSCDVPRRFASAEEKYVPPKVWQPTASGGKFANINAPTAGVRTQENLSVGKHPIQLYSFATPNGVKASIMLEEICEVYPDFDYDAWRCPIDGKQFTSGFVSVNPNSKIPCMLDQSSSPAIRVFESGAMLIYLAEKYPECKLLPTDPAKRAETLSWLMWQMGSAPYLGGGLGHFYAYAPEKMKYPIDRFAMETKRQLDVLDKCLAENKFIAGDEYTIADIAIWPWYGALVLRRLYGAGDFLSVDEYKHVVRWAKMLEEDRPALRRGRMVTRGAPDTENKLYADLPAMPERHSREDWKRT